MRLRHELGKVGIVKLINGMRNIEKANNKHDQ